ncbi:MAG: CBS domain-containing protein [Rubrobacteraceae bacterium]
MGTAPDKLLAVAEQLKAGKEPASETVRSFIGWFDAKGRGPRKVQEIRGHLASHEIETQPDFNLVNIDSPIRFVTVSTEEGGKEDQSTESTSADDTNATSFVTSQATFVSGAVADLTHRISRLASATKTQISVKPDSTLQEAVHLMMLHNFSQLPIMQGKREVKGIISWYSIGFRKLAGNSSKVVRDYMEPHQEIKVDASLFDAIPLIVNHQYVLVRDTQNKISGIVTTSDLSLQFGQLSEPFLFVGEVENHIRGLIDGKFTADELASCRAPSDEEREVERIDELTFGAYQRLLENPEHWHRLALTAMDRRGFIEQLDDVRQIRNRGMHFEPDGLEEEDLRTLRRFVELLRKLQKLNET